ncbi:unnamed protein product [Amoebophrya sp. A120]|nr:unnamed protein product [Amoebophrya sp. A120]|eukprot:GSA120T00016100001.1
MMFSGRIRENTGRYPVGVEEGMTDQGVPYRFFFPLPARAARLQTHRAKHVRDWCTMLDGQYWIVSFGAGRISLRATKDDAQWKKFLKRILFHDVIRMCLFSVALVCNLVSDFLSAECRRKCCSFFDGGALSFLSFTLPAFNLLPAWQARYFKSECPASGSSDKWILYSHGLTASTDEHALLHAEWASHGYRVFALHHTEGSACQVWTVDGGSGKRKRIDFELAPFTRCDSEIDEEVERRCTTSAEDEKIAPKEAKSRIFHEVCVDWREKRCEQRAQQMFEAWKFLEKRYEIFHCGSARQEEEVAVGDENGNLKNAPGKESQIKQRQPVKPILAGFSYGATTAQVCLQKFFSQRPESDPLTSPAPPFSTNAVVPAQLPPGPSGTAASRREEQGEKQLHTGAAPCSCARALISIDGWYSIPLGETGFDFPRVLTSAVAEAKTDQQVSIQRVPQFWNLSEEFARRTPEKENQERIAKGLFGVAGKKFPLYKGVLHMEMCELPNFIFVGAFARCVALVRILFVHYLLPFRDKYFATSKASTTATSSSELTRSKTATAGHGGDTSKSQTETVQQEWDITAPLFQHHKYNWWLESRVDAVGVYYSMVDRIVEFLQDLDGHEDDDSGAGKDGKNAAALQEQQQSAGRPDTVTDSEVFSPVLAVPHDEMDLKKTK